MFRAKVLAKFVFGWFFGGVVFAGFFQKLEGFTEFFWGA